MSSLDSSMVARRFVNLTRTRTGFDSRWVPYFFCLYEIKRGVARAGKGEQRRGGVEHVQEENVAFILKAKMVTF